MKIIDKFIEIIVRTIVKKRLEKGYNKYKLIQYDEHQILKQLKTDEICRLVNAKQKNNISFTNDSEYIKNYAYSDGLAYAKELLDSGKYNLAYLSKVMELIPNSVEFITFGKEYGIGFFEGLFGWYKENIIKNKSDINIFVGIWRNKLVNEFYNNSL